MAANSQKKELLRLFAPISVVLTRCHCLSWGIPRCFKNVNLLPTEYDFNTKAWMTGEIFTRLAKKFRLEMSLPALQSSLDRRQLPCSHKAQVSQAGFLTTEHNEPYTTY